MLALILTLFSFQRPICSGVLVTPT